MFTKLVRVGRDAEMKYLPSGTAILEMSVVYDVGFGENKKPQWVKLAMFGNRAEKLVSHFTKGKLIVATMDDVKADAWIKDNEAKSAISAKLVEFEFAGGGQPQQGQQQAPAQQQSWGNAPQAPQAPQQQAAPSYQQAPAQSAPTQRPQAAPVPQNPATQNPHQQPAPAQYNEPSMDFDDDIPFAPIGLQYPALLLSM